MATPHPSPLLRLPPELRTTIYRLALTTSQHITIYHTPPNPSLNPSSILYRASSRVHPHQWRAIHTALLRTSRQTHQEASAILYGENRFYYHFYARRLPGPTLPFGAGMGTLRRVRDLAVVTHVCGACPAVERACEFLEMLKGMGCVFRRMEFRYELGDGESEGFLRGYLGKEELVAGVAAVEVEQEVEVWVRGGRGESGLWKGLWGFVEGVARGKGWVAREIERAEDAAEGGADGVRYRIQPKMTSAGGRAVMPPRRAERSIYSHS